MSDFLTALVCESCEGYLKIVGQDAFQIGLECVECGTEHYQNIPYDLDRGEVWAAEGKEYGR